MYQHANKGQFPQKNFVLGVVESKTFLTTMSSNNLNRKSEKKNIFVKCTFANETVKVRVSPPCTLCFHVYDSD